MKIINIITLLLTVAFQVGIAKAIKKTTTKNSKSVQQVKLPVWKPKESQYNPRLVNWASVISGCKAACRYEKRLCNFYIRAASHDALAISEGHGGADGSIITADEMRRPENRYESFVHVISKNIIALASKYDASAADVVAVCGAVATEFLGGPVIISRTSRFRVGRYDRTEPNPANALAPANINTTRFGDFAKSKGLSIEEMTALMGAHSLLDEGGCKMSNGAYCDPLRNDCSRADLKMFKWSSVYYRETCRATVRVNDPPIVSQNPLPKFGVLLKNELCKYTSQAFRKRGLDEFMSEFTGFDSIINANDPVEGADFEMDKVSWYDNNTKRSHGRWEYTVNDAWLGETCQNTQKNDAYSTAIRGAMRTYMSSDYRWNEMYKTAYKKMMNIGASWAVRGGFEITGAECPSGYSSNVYGVNCRPCRDPKMICPRSCYCVGEFKENEAFYE